MAQYIRNALKAARVQPSFSKRPADAVCEIPTLPQAALIYRLNGDTNPLHADPVKARFAGFPGPLLHGRCTFGIAAWALLRMCCGYDPRRLLRMRARFSSPVYPGETVRIEIWQDDSALHFRALVPARNAVVLSQGTASVLQLVRETHDIDR